MVSCLWYVYCIFWYIWSCGKIHYRNDFIGQFDVPNRRAFEELKEALTFNLWQLLIYFNRKLTSFWVRHTKFPLTNKPRTRPWLTCLKCVKIFSVGLLLKRLAYTLTAYCYGSKSVTQADVSSKHYLWDKISCDKSYTKQLGQISISEHCKRSSYCLARFSQFKVNKNKNNKFLKY